MLHCEILIFWEWKGAWYFFFQLKLRGVVARAFGFTLLILLLVYNVKVFTCLLTAEFICLQELAWTCDMFFPPLNHILQDSYLYVFSSCSIDLYNQIQAMTSCCWIAGLMAKPVVFCFCFRISLLRNILKFSLFFMFCC